LATLKEWDGSNWNKKVLKVYKNNSFQSKPTYYWDGADWIEIDIYG
jgi:hypothetical protein